jgi:chromosome segregation ATPase
MIVTADPLGDFNATSQILRYSALAREITVPRTPSVSSQIVSASATHKPFQTNGRCTPSDTGRETMENAALEIARMSEEIDGLRDELSSEQQKRYEAEAHLQSAEERMLEIEQEIREECYEEMESRLAMEMQRWKARWAEEADRNDEHLDRKLEVFSRGIDIYADSALADERIMEVEEENRLLKMEIDQLRRENGMRSPSKKMASKEPRNRMDAGEVHSGLEKLRLGEVNRTGKKVRKLTARKWDLGDEGEAYI